MKLQAFLTLGCLIFAGTDARASLFTNTPDQVCHWLDSVNLETRGWHRYQDGTEGCNSAYRELTGTPLPNVLAYYVDGRRNAVSKAWLELSVHDPMAIQDAHKELVRAARLLVQNATGKPMPSKLERSIMAETATHLQIGGTTVTISWETWPSRRGYDVHVEVK